MEKDGDGTVVMVTLLVGVQPLAQGAPLLVGFNTFGIMIKGLLPHERLQLIRKLVPNIWLQFFTMLDSRVAHPIAHQKKSIGFG